jgi:hypothetical protein
MRHEKLTRKLINELSAGIRVLRLRDGIVLSDDPFRERADTLVAAVLGNYEVRSQDGDDSPIGLTGVTGERKVRIERRGEATKLVHSMDDFELTLPRTSGPLAQSQQGIASGGANQCSPKECLRSRARFADNSTPATPRFNAYKSAIWSEHHGICDLGYLVLADSANNPAKP